MLIHKLRNNTIKKYKKAFKYPFSFILKNKFENYDIRKITRIMFDTKLQNEKIDISKVNFPENINKVYWYQEGENDKFPWLMIAQIKYGKTYKYIYYVADCDYTGFDCQGNMVLYISKSLSKIIDYAVPKKIKVKIDNYLR
jgi:hypothetical protein